MASPQSYGVGDQVQVRYRANGPADSAAVDRGLWNWTYAVILGVIGLPPVWLIRKLSSWKPPPSPAYEIGMEFFEAHQAEFGSRYSGKVIAIKGRAVIGVYEDSETAIKETQQQHSPGTFIVLKVEPGGTYKLIRT
jgi:hypothetical protein